MKEPGRMKHFLVGLMMSVSLSELFVLPWPPSFHQAIKAKLSYYLFNTQLLRSWVNYSMLCSIQVDLLLARDDVFINFWPKRIESDHRSECSNTPQKLIDAFVPGLVNSLIPYIYILTMKNLLFILPWACSAAC